MTTGGAIRDAITLAAVFACLGMPQARAVAQARPDLIGQVHAPTGAAVTGARVSIYTAGVRQGVSPFCPSCYADCAKSAMTDRRGRFRIASLDPQLRFRLLIVAEGYEPTFVRKVDPLLGPVRVALPPRGANWKASSGVVRGRVLGPNGAPVVGATVEPFGRESKWGARFGDLPGVDPLAVTDARGAFALFSKEPGFTLDVQVKARGLATHVYRKVSVGPQIHTFQLSEGASVSGRLMNAGKPLASATVGLVQVDRNIETFVGTSEIGTDSQGRFLFSSITPNTEYYVYGEMASAGHPAASPVERIHVGGNKSDTDAGDLAVAPRHSLSGRIVLLDGKPIPPGIRVLLSRRDAWDSQLVMADTAGHFTAAALPDEMLELYLSVPGYRLAAPTPGLNPTGPQGRRGLVLDPAAAQITLSLEPGDQDKN